MSSNRNEFPIAKKVQSLYHGRIRQFNDPNGQYASLNLPRFFDHTRIDHDEFIKLSVYDVPDFQRPKFSKVMEDAVDKWRVVHKGDWFGPSWSTHWFKVELRIPRDWPEKYTELPLLDFDSADEGLIYHEDGTVVHGLSGEHRRTDFIIDELWVEDGDWHTIYIETSCNDISGNGSPPDPNRQFQLRTADLVVPNQQARALNIDYWLLGDCAREFPDGSWQRNQAFDLLNQIVNRFDSNNPEESILACRELAASYFGNVNSEKVFAKRSHTLLDPNLVWSIGNCHIDTAWLWPYAETRRKIARSWSSQLDLLERYPEYVFTASQAVQFSWLKEDHPKLFERVKKAVKHGRFVPVGGSWVECDTNMPSGESLIRQMVLGQRLFQKEFGMRSKVFWLPDTFGYAPQLPQICQHAGMPYFLTQKLSWNNIDVFPLSTFTWVGLDGSAVVCHMPPTNTYTAEVNFGDVKRSIEQHKNLDTSRESLMLFGYGDGGGGPTAEMLEKLRRCRGIANETKLLPGTVTGLDYTPKAFFDTVAKNDGKELPTWRGELYLEYHRGTYTTQAAIKQGNRLSESIMRDLEMFATAASLHNKDYKYPFSEIESLWKKVCLNQFHDVLPGSGIEMIYTDARRIYEEIREEGDKLIAAALKALGVHEGHKDAVNSITSCVEVPSDVHEEFYHPDDYESVECEEDEENIKLESENLKVEFKNGEIVSIFDCSQNREVLLKGGVGNQLLLFEDQPMNFPAWDTEQYATEKFLTIKPNSWVQVDERTVKLSYKFSNSTMEQEVILRDNFIEFKNNVDWHETYQFLKVEFPVDIESDYASYETSFGVQRRPTHFNTSWDAAKFEVSGHRFADLSEYGYGVSLINDCKYGYSIHGKSMRLSLLRSPKSPDANADMGKHEFRYALYPHNDSLTHETIHLAQMFNQRHYTINAQKSPNYKLRVHPFKLTGSPNVAISAVKRADADQRSGKTRVIVRVYETLGGRASVNLTSSFSIKSARFVNALEDLEFEDDDKESNSSLDVLDNRNIDSVPFKLKPFEIATIMLEL